MTDPMNNELPNLSTWHRVPDGSTIPKDTPYAYTHAGALTVDLDGYFSDITVGQDDYPHYTERPIAPPLPTEEGATILGSATAHHPDTQG